MKMKRIMLAALFLIQPFFLTTAFAERVVVYGLDAMPLCGVVDGKPAGITVEILQEATLYGAPEFKFVMDVPWLRAQMMVQNPGNELNAIIPFSRSPQREDTFKWLGELIQTQFRLYSFNRATPVLTAGEAAGIPVGVVRGHAIIPLLQELGINKLDEAPNAEINAKKLQHKRFDTIAESDFIAFHNWRKIGEDTSLLQEGLAIGEITRVYIAAGLHFPDATAKKIADALNKMEKDGKLQEILNRWR
ncbi:ABC-type amino acid transport substrate-binding protein [Desulfobotulus alkaliphilus]|uniref:ABC-type amino acid transport substrate-binding protein n=1 Tax=Desulfobotulus alkaliphilus TaxID=622671 RepID=A0A562S0N5_9BACT|nr:ABC transporter substrate-binding protein [Desulfobotulus alkaliphilus]TWI74110.1 ABC-type amino acid transport substrate-binding protein [Desulfobotulus alkaliphilus]